jgi:hypothetical protein
VKILSSDQRRQANVANAKASTGPRTRAGKARSSANGFRHGLNVSIWDDSTLANCAEKLAMKIAGTNAAAETLVGARAIAEAQFLLEKVRARRIRLLQSVPALDSSNRLPPFETIEGSEPNEPQRFDVEFVENAVSPAPLDPDARLLRNLDDRKLEFVRLERYERRALSMRRSAIRDFDAHLLLVLPGKGARTKR